MRMHVLLVAGCAIGCRVAKEATDTALMSAADLLMISETATGRVLFATVDDGVYAGEVCLSEIHPEQCTDDTSDLAKPCLMFASDHQRIDDEDWLLLTYTLRDPDLPFAPGAVARVRPVHPPTIDWAMTQLSFSTSLAASEGIDCSDASSTAMCNLNGAHIAISDGEGGLVIADTSNSRILWIAPPAMDSGETTGTVTAVLSTNHPQWGTERLINNIQRIESGTSVWLLATFKGGVLGDELAANEGRVVLWDVTDRDDPERLWAYPEQGTLAAVHHAIVQETPIGTTLLYAHSRGASDSASDGLDGSIGFAQFLGVEPPSYLGDGRVADGESLGFTREVEWQPDSESLWITDSGCENSDAACELEGVIVATAFPTLSPTERSGAFSPDHAEQVFVDLLPNPIAFDRSLAFPYEVDSIATDQQGSDLRNRPIGSCE